MKRTYTGTVEQAFERQRAAARAGPAGSGDGDEVREFLVTLRRALLMVIRSALRLRTARVVGGEELREFLMVACQALGTMTEWIGKRYGL